MCDVLEPGTVESAQQQILYAGNSLTEMFAQDNLIPILAISLGCGVAVIAIVMGSIKTMVVARTREATKREMAAYVAEGTISPDKAIAMLNAGEESAGDEDEC